MTPVYRELPLFDPVVFAPMTSERNKTLPTNNWHQVGYCQRINHYPKIFVTASDRTVNIGQTYAEGLGTGSKKRRNHDESCNRRLPFQLIRYTDEGRFTVDHWMSVKLEISFMAWQPWLAAWNDAVFFVRHRRCFLYRLWGSISSRSHHSDLLRRQRGRWIRVLLHLQGWKIPTPINLVTFPYAKLISSCFSSFCVKCSTK